VSSTTTTGAVFEPPLPHAFGQYELLEELARGGMGIIYKARQVGLNRLCAVKMVRRAGGVSGTDAERGLEAEAAAAASLSHPNIVRIYEVGREQGQLFFSMEYIPGEELGPWARSRVLDATAVARLVRELAGAVEYAHSRGIWHHDLKPANVLVDAEGHLRLMDFGLARRRDFRTQPDASAGVGSPNYLAPEQASDRFGEPRAVTDVFGLGGILYHLLTDRPPFQGETVTETLKAVLEQDPPRPGSLRTGVPPDLEAICLKCLEKRPSRRYPAVSDVVLDLDRFLRDEPIAARKVSAAGGLLRWGLKRPWWPLLGAAAVVGVAVFLRRNQERIAGLEATAAGARTARDSARASEADARRNLYAGDLALAFAANAGGHAERVREILDRQRPAAGQPDLRGWEWHFLDGLVRSDRVAVLGRLEGDVQRLQMHPDGRHVLAVDTMGTLAEWELPSGRELRRRVVRPAGLSGLVLSPDGSWLALNDRLPGATNTLVHILDTASWATNRSWAVPGLVGPRAVSDDGQTLWLTGRDLLVALSVPTGAVREVPVAAQRQPAAVALSPDDQWLVVSYGPRAVAWIPTDGPADPSVRRFESRVKEETEVGPEVLCMAFSPDGRWLLSGCSDGRIRVWDTESREVVGTWDGHSGAVQSLRFHPDGTRVVSVGRDPVGRVWEFPSGRELGRIRGLRGFTSDVAWSGDEVLTAGGDRAVERWKASAGMGITALTNVPPSTFGASLLPDGAHAMVAGATGVQIWTLPSGEVLQQLPSDADALASAFVHQPKASHGVAARYWVGGRIGVRSLELEGRTTSVEEPGWIPVPRFSGAADLVFDAVGSQLAVVDTANGVRVYSVEPLELKHRFELPLARTAVFSPDGKRLAAVAEGRIAVWEPGLAHPTLKERVIPNVQAAGFSPKGDRLMVTTMDGRVLVLDPSDPGGKPVSALATMPGGFLSVAMSGDGSRVVAGSTAGAVVIWDTVTRRELGILPVGATPVYSLRFSDDQTLVVASGEGIRMLSAARK
jgi:WD40 repeat protein/predicted Ser/Thr protein kinase